MKHKIKVGLLILSLAVSACERTNVEYFVQPTEGMRLSSLSSSGSQQSSGIGLGGLVLGVLVVGALVSATSPCRPAQYRPVIGGSGGLYWDGGTC